MSTKTKTRKRVIIIGAALASFLLLATVAYAVWQSYAETSLNVTTKALPDIEYVSQGTSTNVGGATCSRSIVDGGLVITMTDAQPGAGCDINGAQVQNVGTESVLVDAFEWALPDGTPNPDIAVNPALDGSSGAPIEYAVTLTDEGNNPITLPHFLNNGSGRVLVSLQIRVTDDAMPSTVYDISGGGLRAIPNS